MKEDSLDVELAALASKLNADHVALLSLVLLISKQLGLSDIDGLTPQKWYEQQRVIQLEKRLLQIEDRNPRLAAVMQQQIDAWKKPPV
jgi:hypothetical protein